MSKKLHSLSRPPSELRLFGRGLRCLFLCLLIAFEINASPETTAAIEISGKVLDETGQPLPGVNILEKGTTNGATSNADGLYKISVAGETSVLIFSFIGYATQEFTVGVNSTLNVSLDPDIASLQEVVVTALGIKKESKKLGYATATVATDQIQLNRTLNFMESLSGKVAGLDISPPAAGAGASTKIRLRGQTAFSGANNAPLIVVNGLPMDQGAVSADGPNASRDRGDALQNFNPDDIENITILKGSTAAALYGSRAANGAIIITTRSGQKGQGVGVEYISNYTVNTVLDFTDLQQEYGQGTWNAIQGTGLKPTDQGSAVTSGAQAWGARLDGQPVINFDGVERPYSAHPDRVKEFYRDGTSFTNTVALSGGNEKGSFRASFSNVDAKGITPNNTYSKKIANLGLNYDITDKLKFSLNTNYGREKNINPPQVGVQGSGEANFLYRMSGSIPLSAFKESAVNPANSITELPTSGFQTTLINPYFSMYRQFFRDNRDRLLATATLRYDFTKWLYLQGRYNYDRSTLLSESNVPTGQASNSPFNNPPTGYNGSFQLNTSRGNEINADFLLGAKKDAGSFSIDASVGGNTYRTNYGFTGQSVTDFVTLGIYSLANGLNPNLNTYTIDRRRVNSLYGVAEIGYKGIAFLNVTDRQDWFSVLNPEDNTQNYWSASGSFIFSEVLGEDQKWLSYGKVRGSYAKTGSAGGVNFAEYLLSYNVAPNPFPNGTAGGQKLGSIANATAPNGKLTPFTTTEKEIGLEMKFFDRRVSLDVAAYTKTTDKQIINVLISNSTGYTGTKQNLGQLENRGLEFYLEVVPVAGTNFKWTTAFNTAYNKSKVLSLGEGRDNIIQINFNNTGNEFIGQLVYQVGQQMNQLSAKTYLRDDNGNILVDNNGRLLATTNFVNFGSGLPTVTGGWNNTFSYKKLSLFVQVDFKGGGKIMSSSALNWLRQGMSKESLVGREGGVVFNAVRQSDGGPNTTAANPQTFYTDYRTLQIADPFIFKNDFVKLRNITLSYDFTSLLASKTQFIKGVTLAAACRNVWLIYKDLPNLDPEAFASSGDNRVGYEGTTPPTTRNYSLTLNARF